MENPDTDRFGLKTATTVLGALILVVVAVGLLFTFIMIPESAPQQTVQELRYIKWLLVGLFGLLLIRA